MYMYLLNSPSLKRFKLSTLTRATVSGQAMPEAQLRAAEEAFRCHSYA